MENKVQLDYEILGNAPQIILEGEASPDSEKFVENSLLELGRAMARHSIGEVPFITAENLKQDEDIAKALSVIQVDDPHFKDLDPITDELDIISLAIGKAEAIKEIVTDPKAKSKLTSFEEKVAETVHKLLNTKNKFTKRAIAASLSLALTACGINTILPTATPEVVTQEPVVTQPSPTTEGSQPATPTDTETQTPTNTETPTDTPTPTETPLPILSENPTADELFAAKEG